MFNNSQIDKSGLTSPEPIIKYDDSQLRNEGYKLRYALNPKNPVYNQVINACKAQGVLFKTVPTENDQEHIWIK